jgi:hypothetical protein
LAADEPIDGDGPPVATLRLRDVSVLTGLWPSRDDVRLLSHVRQVNMADSALAGADDDGWFAVVAANRLPTRAGKYTACLVSLEGQDGVWSGPPAGVPPLVVLYQWRFEVTTAGTFESLAAGLDLGLLGKRPGDAAVDPTVTLTRVDRDGVTSSVRYRGPLLPVPADDTQTAAPQDVSTDAAGQIGRLVATADGRFTREIVAWHRAQNLGQARQMFQAAVHEAAALADAGDGLDFSDVRAALRRRLAETSVPVADPFGVPPAARRLAAGAAPAEPVTAGLPGTEGR